jgi:UDP-N-acetylglucosamine:LPS N-acetylglucosamine transferase
MDVLVATSRDTPAELATPVVAAIEARDLGVGRVDLGRVGETGSRLGRVVQALIGEAEAGRLLRELKAGAPRVAVAFDPGALAALVLARDRGVARTAVIAVVPELTPGKGWAVNADRYVVLDDEAAVALADHGVDGARVTVTGPIVPRALFEAAERPRAELRRELKVPEAGPVALVDTRGLSLEALAQLTLQLSLLARPVHILFDAAASADAAAQLRRQVPPLGIKGKLFGDTPSAPRLWRCADVIIARPTARAIHAAAAVDAGLVALEPDGARQEADVRGLIERHAGAAATRILFVSAALEPLLGRKGRGATPPDGASETAELVALVAAHHEDVLAETASSAPPAAATDEERAADVEELDGLDLGDAAGPEAPRRPAPPSGASDPKRARLEREVAEMRLEAERWEQRRVLAEAKGDRALAEQAAREADRKRARMHAALADLARAAAAPPPPEDPLAALKRRAAQAGVKSLEDELAALKAKIGTEKKPR